MRHRFHDQTWFEQKHKLIFDWIRRHAVISKQQIQELTSLSHSSLTRTLDELCAEGVLLQAGLGESSGGRRPILYRPNGHYGYLVGIEISRTFSKLVLFDMNLNRIAEKTWEMHEHMIPSRLVTAIVESLTGMLVAHHLTISHVLGIGIGAVGPVNRHEGVIQEPLYFQAPGWKLVPLGKLIGEKLDVPVFVDNGANMALLGEYSTTRNQLNPHILYVHVGVGIRSAMMSSGKLVYGAVDWESSIGQMVIEINHPRKRADNNDGALESYGSLYAVEQQARIHLQAGKTSILRQEIQIQAKGERIPYHKLVEAYRKQDSLTQQLFHEAVTYVGIGIGNLLNVLHPEKVILGGPFFAVDATLFETAKSVAMKHTYHYPKYHVEFSSGQLGKDAIVTGAAEMVMQHLFG